MKCVFVLLGTFLVFACGDVNPRQTDPGGHGHVPNVHNAKYILDQRREVIAIVTASGCYLYHLTDAQLISVGDPGGLDSMEHMLIHELTTTHHFPLVAHQEFIHLSHSIKSSCKSSTTFDIHDVRNV